MNVASAPKQQAALLSLACRARPRSSYRKLFGPTRIRAKRATTCEWPRRFPFDYQAKHPRFRYIDPRLEGSPEVSPEVASKQLAQPIRRALANMRPSRWTDFGLLSHLVLGLRLRAVPVTKELLQSGQRAELEPESEATSDWRDIRREVLHPPIDQVLGRLKLPFPAYVNRPEADRRRREPSHGSGAVGEEPIPVSR